MKNIDIIKVEEYTGTMECLENLVKNLHLTKYDYEFDIANKTLFIKTLGVSYMKGDHYQYFVSNKIEDI